VELKEKFRHVYLADGKVYELVPTVEDGEECEEEVEVTQFPVVVLLDAVDNRDGHGWGRQAVEALGEVVDVYEHDVDRYAVLVRVVNRASLTYLLQSFDGCLEEAPERFR